jgi:hypothetical protein
LIVGIHGSLGVFPKIQLFVQSLKLMFKARYPISVAYQPQTLIKNGKLLNSADIRLSLGHT